MALVIETYLGKHNLPQDNIWQGTNDRHGRYSFCEILREKSYQRLRV